ncbi:MAG: hypothetical protein MI741_11550 [Rhodospirillales bacterium]|nr:hypothetical protein [Rhodospirillales bacterium]
MRAEAAPGFPAIGEAGLFWLGQAGFWIETGEHRVLIDPYLSDSLAEKYAGKKHDHKRMMPPPSTVERLPVNGRDAQRLADGIPGNFSFSEALELARSFPFLVPHHFGMFAFNTLAPETIEAASAKSAGNPRILSPEAGRQIRIFPKGA